MYYEASKASFTLRSLLKYPSNLQKIRRLRSSPSYVAAGDNSSLPSALFPIDNSCFALLVKLVMEISQENTTLAYLWLTVNLEHGVDAITASGNGDSEVEKQTAKSAVGIY